MQAKTAIRTVALALTVCGALLAQPPCSVQNFTGVWSYVAIGWAVPVGSSTPAPLTMIGVMVVDYSGKVTGPGTVVQGAPIPGTSIPTGQPLEFEMTEATLEVNANCTGLLKYSILLKGGPAVGPYVDRLIADNKSGELVGMGYKSPLSKPMWIWKCKRISNVPAAVAWPEIN